MEWPLKKISEVAEIISGGTPKTDISEYWGDDIFWITPADMGKMPGIYASATRRKISNLGLSKSSAKLIPENSVILSTRAPIGHLVINTVPMATNQGCRGLVSKGGIDTKYLFYFLLSSIDFLNELGTGTTFKELSKTALGKIKIPTPLINEQKRIVAILDQAFADIDHARALTEQNLKNARELFESYLQQVFKQRGEGWVDKSLKEVSLDFGRGKSKHRPRNDEALYGGKYPFIQTGDVRNCEHRIQSFSKTYNEKGLAQSKLWPKDTICITIAANIAETGIMEFAGCFPDSVIGMVVDPEVTSVQYVEYLLQSFRSFLQSKGQGSAQDNINLGTFENIKFPFPDLARQMDIVNNLDALLSSVQRLETIYTKKLHSIDELKKSLLQKAFSGQLIKNTEVAA